MKNTFMCLPLYVDQAEVAVYEVVLSAGGMLLKEGGNILAAMQNVENQGRLVLDAVDDDVTLSGESYASRGVNPHRDAVRRRGVLQETKNGR